MNRLYLGHDYFHNIFTDPIFAATEIYLDIINSLKEQTYSQAQITSIEEFFVNVLGNRGYAFAEVSGDTEIIDDSEDDS